ncbi:lysosomal acid phosphatase-like [Pomacea canaliculata]|uniref:lysosomal acid phosphatase-like n=1 Tax=Pomacea canaliculata TaxID=400727 RepID=UPI000D73800A|nr:lysosomal acid phosphatase-like [Pomacea canaliculata]
MSVSMFHSGVHPCSVAVVLMSLVTVSYADLTLRMVNVLYRHGDRSPTMVYPTDPYKLTAPWWPQGPGCLTPRGMEQQCELGQFLRKEYGQLLNSTYVQSEIHVQSSDEQRCLMSAYCNLACLYPPTGSQVWNSNINWQPIPVHTRPKEEDNTLNFVAPCPRHSMMLKEELTSDAFRQEETENAEFYSMVVNNTGLAYVNISIIWGIADTTFCERAHNLSLPSWVTDEVYNKLQSLSGLFFNLMFNRTEMSRLRGGPLLKEMLMNINSTVHDPGSQTYKMFMYSVHDFTVVALLTSLQVFNNMQTPYAAAVLLELWYDDHNHDYVVRLRYRNDTSVEPYNLVIPGCNNSYCPLTDFVKFAQTRIPADWDAECGNTRPTPGTPSNKNDDDDKTTVIALAVVTAVVILLCLGLIVFIVCQRGRRQANFG